MPLPPPPTFDPPAERPKLDVSKNIKEMADSAAADAMNALHDIATDPDQKPAARVAAANSILDRALGKASIVSEVTVNFNTIIDQIHRASGRIVDVTPTLSVGIQDDE